MKLRQSAAVSIAVAAALAVAPATVRAVSIGFGAITANNVGDVAIGESQLSVDVTDGGGGLVRFHFVNSGPEASSIADIYFDDGSLLAIAQLIDADDGVGGLAGVDFSQDANPPELPGANNASPTFETTAGFLADSDPPAQPNGVNPDEWLEILFSLQGGQVFDDVVGELTSGELRIGIHVQGFATGGSESFVNDPLTPPGGGTDVTAISAPEPGTLALMGVGLVGLGVAARRRRA